MTVSTTTAANSYLGNGAVATYAYSFLIHADSDLRVTKEDDGGNVSTLTLITDYTVSGTGDAAGGTITLTAGNLPSGYSLVIARSVDFLQQTSLPEGSRFQGSTLERVFDRLCMMCQQLLGLSDRSIKLPASETAATDLPAASTRAGLALIFDANGNPAVGGIPSVSSTTPGAWDATPVKSTGTTAYRKLGDRFSEVVNVKDFGAVGDGVTDDTASIQLALDRAGVTGDSVYFPAGVYVVSAILARSAWASACYALRPSGNGLRMFGDGDSSVVKLSAHESPTAGIFPIVFLLNNIVGHVSVQDIKVESPARANTTHNGPMAFSGGELGATAASGAGCHLSLERVTINRCSFAIHGQRFLSVRMRDCNVVIQGGGSYPTYFSEGINIGNKSDGSEVMDCLSVTGCTWTCDGTYDDHLLYSLADIARVEFVGNTILAGSKNELLKLDGLSGGLIRNFGNITFKDNRLITASSAIVFSGNGSAKDVTISGNVVSDGCNYFLYTEFFMDVLRVEGNVAKSCQRSALNVVKNGSLATNIGATCLVSHNDFDGYDSLGANVLGIKVEAHKMSTFIGNRCRPGNAGSGRVLGGPTSPDCESVLCVGNIGGTGTVPPWISYPDSQAMAVFVDSGNDWSFNEGVGTAAPTSGTWKRGARVWNLSPSVGGAPGWVCVSGGTPGTWKAMANLAP